MHSIRPLSIPDLPNTGRGIIFSRNVSHVRMKVMEKLWLFCGSLSLSSKCRTFAYKQREAIHIHDSIHFNISYCFPLLEKIWKRQGCHNPDFACLVISLSSFFKSCTYLYDYFVHFGSANVRRNYLQQHVHSWGNCPT